MKKKDAPTQSVSFKDLASDNQSYYSGGFGELRKKNQTFNDKRRSHIFIKDDQKAEGQLPA